MKYFYVILIMITFLVNGTLNLASAGIVIGRGESFNGDIDSAILKNPNNADLFNIRGNKYLSLRQYERAIDDFSKAIKLNKYYAEPYNGRGVAYRNIKLYSKAIEDYNSAISINPNYIEAYKNRGVAYMSLNDKVSMCRDFKKSCSLGDCSKFILAQKKGLCN